MFSKRWMTVALLCGFGACLVGGAEALGVSPPADECGDGSSGSGLDSCTRPLCPPVTCWPCPVSGRATTDLDEFADVDLL